MKKHCQTASVRWGLFASFDRLRPGTTIAAILLIAGLGKTWGAEEEPDPFESSKPSLPLGDVRWIAGETLRFDTPAVRLGDTPFFACLRPEDSPRAKPAKMTYLGREFEIELLATDWKTGLSLLQSPAAKEAAASALSVEPQSWPAPATPILAVDPRSKRVISGRIAGRDLIYQGEELPATLLRVNLEPDAKFERALPLIDASRETLIGILIPHSLDSPGEFHAVPAAFVAKLLKDFESLEESVSGKLGASFEVGSTTPRIVSVRVNSAADRAGLRRGDVVLRIGKWKIRRLSDVIETLRLVTPEVPVEVELLRGLKTLQVEVIPEAADAR